MGTSKAKTFDDILHNIRTNAKSTTELGRQFERLTRDFFKIDSMYSRRFRKVYLWSEWPKRDGTDTGIDIIAEQFDGKLCAVQCKCYDDNASLDMKSVAKFLAKANSLDIENKILVYTGDTFTNHAQKLLQDSKCAIIDQEHFRSSSIDWNNFPKLARIKDQKRLRPHQVSAVQDVIRGFKDNSRGKLIMACGTGKTITALHIAEKQVGVGGIVLYIVPSISLILQSMREWSDNANIVHNYMAVCSDKSTGEDGSITELESPVSTDHSTLRPYILSRPKSAMTVIFSTYHSLDVIKQAAKDISFDLILCDEAHRTTGVEDKSFFTVIHKDTNIHGKKRLYMTATPRVYSDVIQAKMGKVIYSMDNEEKYGPTFHRLSFTAAVKKGVLADFRVKIAIVPADKVDKQFQQAVADDDNSIPLDERTLLAAVWHGIQYPDDNKNPKLLQRVIAFANRIDRSLMFAGEITDGNNLDRSFASIVSQYEQTRKTGHSVQVKHMDGKTRAIERRDKLRWLDESTGDPKTCRIVSNARCLSEGVDVPALDGVIFLNPRKSRVDVVQSVGRVMRKSEGKRYGYVILPVAIPAGVEYHTALDNNKTFAVVWQVLNALRSHDESFGAEINSLILDKNTENTSPTPRISVSVLDDSFIDNEPITKFFDHVKSQLVKKVGDVDYYDKYGEKIGHTARTIQARIENLLSNKTIQQKIDTFHTSLKELINDSISRQDTIQAIAHHMVLAPVFDALFTGQFTSYNPISRAFEDIVKEIGLREELETLEEFYDEVNQEIKNINTDQARQAFIKKIYGNFFESADKKGSEQHGIVYTPIEIVDFIINSVQHVLKKEFNTEFADRQVKVLDPFTGTGTFLARLLESGYLDRNIYEKYKHDLYANELILLAYYVATVNIETVYSSRRQGHRHVPFDGISYTDTLKINPLYREDARHRGELKPFDGQFKQAHERVHAQRWSHLHVIVGNPPYSAGQNNFNDQNQNMKYPVLDKRIEDSYIKKSLAHNKVSLYDSYIRSLRWAADRIGESGIIGFVTNAGFIRSDSGSGVRAALHKEFTDIYCFDLRGNARTQGEIRKKEAGTVFDSGSRAPVAITILVKNPNKKQHTIHYKDIGDYLSREDKLKTIHDYTSIQGIKDWQTIIPDKHHDWLGQRSDEFERYVAMGNKETKSGKIFDAIFKLYSRGVITSRDTWAYNSSKDILSKNMSSMIDYCNEQNLNKPIIDPKRVKWSSELTNKLRKTTPKFNKNKIRISLYRPFFKQYLYYDKTFNEAQYQIPNFFPKDDSNNMVIVIPYHHRDSPTTVMTNIIPNLSIVSAGQCFPLYTYETGNKQINITDYILNQYQNYYKDKAITKEDIFYYVYGMLHHEGYKKKFASNLQKELPRIPMATNFKKFATAGKRLADLHLNYETCKKYPLKPKQKFGKLVKISFPKVNKDGKKISDKTKLLINGIEVFDLPEIKYTVNGRTPIEWIIDRYRRTVDKDSGIVNDPTENMTEEKTISMVQRLTYVATESDKIINELSKEEFEPKDWKPSPAGLDKFTRSKS